jgi:hypothetical protein
MTGKRVAFPTFELVGPPCPKPPCKGVLVDHMSLHARPREFFRRCSQCGTETDRQPAAEKLAWVKRLLNHVLQGGKRPEKPS